MQWHVIRTGRVWVDPGGPFGLVPRPLWEKYQMPDELIAIYQQFGLDVPKHNGDDSWTLPIPATLIIDTEEVIRHTDINADYTIRPEPAETLSALKKIL